MLEDPSKASKSTMTTLAIKGLMKKWTLWKESQVGRFFCSSAAEHWGLLTTGILSCARTSTTLKAVASGKASKNRSAAARPVILCKATTYKSQNDFQTNKDIHLIPRHLWQEHTPTSNHRWKGSGFPGALDQRCLVTPGVWGEEDLHIVLPTLTHREQTFFYWLWCNTTTIQHCARSHKLMKKPFIWPYSKPKARCSVQHRNKKQRLRSHKLMLKGTANQPHASQNDTFSPATSSADSIDMRLAKWQATCTSAAQMLGQPLLQDRWDMLQQHCCWF